MIVATYESALVDENAATVITVGSGKDHTTIQAAIDAATTTGPTLIQVDVGTYDENPRVSGKSNIVVRCATPGSRYTVRPTSIGAFANCFDVDGALGNATHHIVVRDAILDGANSGLHSTGAAAVGGAYDVDFINCEAFDWGLHGFKTTWGSDNLQTSGCDGVWFVECEAHDTGATSEFGGGGFSHFAMRDIAGSRRSMVFWRCLSYDNVDLVDVGTANWDGNGFIFDVSDNWTGDMVMVRCMSWNNMGRHLDVTRISGGTLHMYMNTSYEDGFPATNPAGPIMAQAVESTGVTANIYGNVWHHTHANGACFKAVTGGFGTVNSNMNVRYDSSGAGTRDWGAITNGANDIVTDPLLANVSTDNMRPGASSPAHHSQSPTTPTTQTWVGFVDPNEIGLDASPALAQPTWGAHADGTAGIPFEFATPSTPSAAATDIDRASVTINGTAPDGSTGHRVRVIDTADSAVLADWVTPTVDAGADTWTHTFDLSAAPAGATVEVQAEID